MRASGLVVPCFVGLSSAVCLLHSMNLVLNGLDDMAARRCVPQWLCPRSNRLIVVILNAASCLRFCMAHQSYIPCYQGLLLPDLVCLHSSRPV